MARRAGIAPHVADNAFARRPTPGLTHLRRDECHAGRVDVSIAIALASLALSLFVLWRQHTAAGRANFIAEWSNSDSVAFVNLGPGAASEVTATVKRDSSRPTDWTKTVAYMPPGQMNGVLVLREWGETLPPLVLSWKDNRLSRQSVSIELPDPPRSTTRTASPPKPDLEKQIRQMAREEVDAQVKEVARRIQLNRRTGWRG